MDGPRRADVSARGPAPASGPALRLLLTIFKELPGETGAHFPKESPLAVPGLQVGGTGATSSQDGFDTMIELDVLSREIDALMALQREAWRELASPSLTTFDRREIRNRIRQGEVELRDHLKARTERLRPSPRPAEPVGNSLANIRFRILYSAIDQVEEPRFSS
jgi:hypothetical protein